MTASTSILEEELRDLVGSVSSVYPEASTPLVSISCSSAYRGDVVSIEAEREHVAASTIKLGVMLGVFDRVDRSEMSLDDLIEVRNEFPSIDPAAGTFSVDAVEDSDFALYKLLGGEVTVRFLIERMITWSSNLATNLLFRCLDPVQIATKLMAVGAGSVTVSRGIEDMAALDNGLRNRVTAQGLDALLRAVVERRAATGASCETMLGVLSRQRWNGEIPELLPAEVVVAHKTGWLENVQHDAAVIYPPSAPPYVLTVLTSGIRDSNVSRHLIQRISDAVYSSVARDPSR